MLQQISAGRMLQQMGGRLKQAYSRISAGSGSSRSVQLHQVLQDATSFYMVMQLCNGGCGGGGVHG